jgi:hypothetical protein
MGDSKFDCSTCTFSNNEAHGAGGALAVLGGTAELDDANFTMNFAVSYGPLPRHLSCLDHAPNVGSERLLVLRWSGFWRCTGPHCSDWAHEW